MIKNKANEVMVRFLLTKGSLIIKEGYYGDEIDSQGGADARGDIDRYLKNLDWNKTQAPHTAVEPIFNGTFADDSEVEYLKCELIMKGSTKRILWKLTLRDMCFEELINMVFEFVENK